MRDRTQLYFLGNYENSRAEITGKVSQCTDQLIQETKNNQGHASTVFSDVYRKLEISVAALAAISLALCIFIRFAMVKVAN